VNKKRLHCFKLRCNEQKCFRIARKFCSMEQYHIIVACILYNLQKIFPGNQTCKFMICFLKQFLWTNVHGQWKTSIISVVFTNQVKHQHNPPFLWETMSACHVMLNLCLRKHKLEWCTLFQNEDPSLYLEHIERELLELGWRHFQIGRFQTLSQSGCLIEWVKLLHRDDPSFESN
jgi:hypothetical protein